MISLATLVIASPSFPQDDLIPVDFFPGVSLDNPLPTEIKTGQEVFFKGRVDIDDAESIVFRFMYTDPTKRGGAGFIAPLFDGKFEKSFVFNHQQSGEFQLEVVVYQLESIIELTEKYTPVMVELGEGEIFLPTRFFPQVTLDNPLPVEFSTGQEILISGSVADSSVTSLSLLLKKIRGGNRELISIPVYRNRFEYSLLFPHHLALNYELEFYLSDTDKFFPNNPPYYFPHAQYAPFIINEGEGEISLSRDFFPRLEMEEGIPVRIKGQEKVNFRGRILDWRITRVVFEFHKGEVKRVSFPVSSGFFGGDLSFSDWDEGDYWLRVNAIDDNNEQEFFLNQYSPFIVEREELPPELVPSVTFDKLIPAEIFTGEELALKGKIRNIEDVKVVIFDFKSTEESEEDVRYWIHEKEGTFSGSVIFNRLQAGEYSLVIFSENLATTLGEFPISVKKRETQARAELVLNPIEVDFGSSHLDDEQMETVEITNTGNSPFIGTFGIDGSEFFQAEFIPGDALYKSIDGEINEIVLLPGESSRMKIVYSPLLSGEFSAEIKIHQEGFDEDVLQLELRGKTYPLGPDALRVEAYDLKIDGDDNLYIATEKGEIIKAGPNGTVRRIVKEGYPIYRIALDGKGNLYYEGHREIPGEYKGQQVIYKVSPDGTHTVVMEMGDYRPDNVFTVDNQGDIYFLQESKVWVWDSETGNRKVVAGADEPIGFYYLAMDANGLLYSLGGNAEIRRIDKETGQIETLVEGEGSYLPFFFVSLSVDHLGNIYYSDYDKVESVDKVKKVDTKNNISVIAGGNKGILGDRLPASYSSLFGVTAVVSDSQGQIYIADNDHSLIRKIGKDGIITSLGVETIDQLVNFDWQEKASSGLIESHFMESVEKILVDPTNSDHWFLLGYFIQESVDGGRSWERLPLPGNGFIALFFDPLTAGKVYTGNWRTEFFWREGDNSEWDYSEVDFGSLLQLGGLVKNDSLILFAVGIDPLNENGIYREKGIYRSQDQGRSWKKIGAESFINPTGISIDKKSDERLLVYGEDGLFFSEDTGETFIQLDNIQTYQAEIRGDLLFSTRHAQGVVFSWSDDWGKTWNEIRNPEVISGDKKLVVNPLNADILYSAGSSNVGHWVARSTNGGESWIFSELEKPILDLTLDSADPSEVNILIGDYDEWQYLSTEFDDPTPLPGDTDNSGPVNAGDGADDLLRGIREEGRWKLDRIVSLGPKAGNGIGVNKVRIDVQREKGYVGASDKVSIVDLSTQVVTDVMELGPGRDELDWIIDWEKKTLIAFETRNLRKGASTSQLKFWDLQSAQVGPDSLDLGYPYPVKRPQNPLSMAFEEETNHLFFPAANVEPGIWVVNTEKREIERKISLTGSAVDLVLDIERNSLYVASASGQSIDVIDTDSLKLVDSIFLGFTPLRLFIDPDTSFLSIIASPEKVSDYEWGYSKHQLLRFDLDSKTLDKSITLKLENPGGTIDPRRGDWYITSGTAGFVIDLESFQIEGNFTWPFVIRDIEIVGDALFLLDQRDVLTQTVLEDIEIGPGVEIGVQPVYLDVSEKKNQVLIPRGGTGGFYVADAEGDILLTEKGPANSQIFVEDFSNRFFIKERTLDGVSQLGVYDLTDFHRINTVEIPASLDFTTIEVDTENQAFWISDFPSNGDRIFEFNLIDGQISAEYGFRNHASQATYLDGFILGGYAVNPLSRTIYLSGWMQYLDSRGKIYFLDLAEKEISKSIEITSFFPSVSEYQPLHLGDISFNSENQLLYVDAEFWPDAILEFDTQAEAVVGKHDIPIDLSGPTIYDYTRNLAYKKGGGIIDLETFQANQSFSGTLSGDDHLAFALNRRTNTIYAIRNDHKLLVYLGPAGTETPSPEIPKGITTMAGDREVKLTWEAVDDSTLVGYHVYRQDRTGSDYIRITPAPLTVSHFTDTDIINQQSYSYAISSVGRFAIESLRSEPVNATPRGGGNFLLLLLKKDLGIARGDSLSIPLGVEALEGFEEEVMLSARTDRGENGIEVLFLPASVVPTKVLEMKIKVAEGALLRRTSFVISGEGQTKKQTVELSIEVTEKRQEESTLSLELDQEEVPLGIPLLVRGRLFPGTQTQVGLTFSAEAADTTVTLDIETDDHGGYRAELPPPFVDRWQVTAAWEGNAQYGSAQSRTLPFQVIAGKTRISCTSDLADDADLGWMATIKGRIYPSPGTVAVDLHVRKPDKSQVVIEGLLTSEEGFYGHDLRMDQKGVWELWASWKGNDRLLGAVSSVVPVPVQEDVGRAILLVGGEDSSEDAFWPTANYLGNLAYRLFQQRRLVKEKVFYLNDRTDQDVDRDGFVEDVDIGVGMSALEDALVWAQDRVNVNNPLYVYMVGRGTQAGLEIRSGEMLSADRLGEKLDILERETGGRTTLIVDASHAGQFIRQLSHQGRQVISSTGPGLAFYQAEGYLSFSQYFLTDLNQGKSMQEAFLHTNNILRNLPGAFGKQKPELEAEGNLIANQPGDYLLTSNAFIGAPFNLGDLAPQVKSASLSSVVGGAARKVVTQTLPVSEDGMGSRLKLAQSQAREGVEIWARIDDPERELHTVRAVIVPPLADSLGGKVGYPEVELRDPDGDGKWVGVYGQFLKPGIYPVIVYAIDAGGNAAEPMRTTVLVEETEETVRGDFNGDGLVDFADFFLFADGFGGTDPQYDMNNDGVVDFGDFFLFADAFPGPLGKLLELAERLLHLPDQYTLRAPYPNPFNREVMVEYVLPEGGEVGLVVYNILGQRVRGLLEGHRPAGYHRVVWDGKDDGGRSVATGMYVVRMQMSEFSQARKVVLVK